MEGRRSVKVTYKGFEFLVDGKYNEGKKGDGYLTPDDPDEFFPERIFLEDWDITDWFNDRVRKEILHLAEQEEL